MLNRTDREKKKESQVAGSASKAQGKKAAVETELERFRDRHIENQQLLPNKPTGLQ